MKQPLTLRIEPDLLDATRWCAAKENRSLTNFVETALKARIESRHGWPLRAVDGARAPDAAANGARGTEQGSRSK
jgi:hypothetical protein